MKRLVIAGLFIAIGFIILGVATANLMSGPDKPPKRPLLGASTTPSKPQTTGADASVVQPTLPSTKPGQPNGASAAPPAPPPLPGMPVPLSTAVQQPPPPHPSFSQPVPVIQPTDLGTPSSPTAGRQHQ